MIAIGRSSRCRHQPAHALGESDLNDWSRSGSRLGAERAGDQRHQRRGDEERGGVDEERHREAPRSSNEPSGGPTNVLAITSMLHMRPLAFSSWSTRTIVGHDRLRRVVAQHLGHAEQQRRQQDDGTGRSGADQRSSSSGPGNESCWPSTANATPAVSTPAQHVHRHHRLAAVDAIGDHAAGSVKTSHGSRCATTPSATRIGLRVTAEASHG